MLKKKIMIKIYLFKKEIQDIFVFQSIIGKYIITMSLFVLGSIFIALKNERNGINFFGKALTHGHRIKWIKKKILRQIHLILSDKIKFGKVIEEHLVALENDASMKEWFEKSEKLLGSRILVIKESKGDERGVLIIDYSYVFPIFLKTFDINEIIKKYYIVLDPSWSGYCNLDILSYIQLDAPVFLHCYEPEDQKFIKSFKSNVIPLPIGANWWIDHRIAKPKPDTVKKYDLIMVAAWADFKRHWNLFKILSSMKKKGKSIKVALIGYPMEYQIDNIEQLAKYYEIDKSIDFFESITPEEVAHVLNQSKICILWSWREGFNRAIIEAMLTDVPVILHENFNYGYKYPYINDKTGSFANEKNLEEIILHILGNLTNYSPRSWILENMTCHHATEILNSEIKKVSMSNGENWSNDIVEKVTMLGSQGYWDKSNDDRFSNDYEYLKSQKYR